MKRLCNHQIRSRAFWWDEKQRASAMILLDRGADGCFCRSAPSLPKPEDLIP